MVVGSKLPPDSGFAGTFIPVMLNEKKDFTIKTAMKQWQDTTDTHTFCFVWGFKDSANFYTIVIGSHDLFSIHKHKNNKTETLSDWASFSKAPFYNSIEIKKKKDKLYFYINRERIHSMDFIPFFGNGIGFMNFSRNYLYVKYLKVKQR